MGDRCTGLEHFSRQSIVAAGSSLILGVDPRLCTPCRLGGSSHHSGSVSPFRVTAALSLFRPSSLLWTTAEFRPWHLRFAFPSSGMLLVAGRLPSWVVRAVPRPYLSLLRLSFPLCAVSTIAAHVNGARHARCGFWCMLCLSGFRAAAPPFLFRYLASWPSSL